MTVPTTAAANPAMHASHTPAALPPGRRPRVPLVPAVAAVAAGILLDRFCSPAPALMLAAGLAAALTSLLARRQPPVSAVALAMALMATGALRHHQRWTARPSTDISGLELRDQTPVRLAGVIESPLEVRKAGTSGSTPAWMSLDRTSFNLRAERLLGAGELPVQGLVRINVSGHLPGLQIGDRVELLGHLRVPGDPRDPDGFDLRNWLKSQGIDRAIDVEHPDAVVWRGADATLAHRLARWRYGLRRNCEQLLADHLSPAVQGVGTSLLLGIRSGITTEVRDAFINSGTMHLLAISGLHVGILAGLVVVLCRLLGFSTGGMALIVVITLCSYSIITDLRPPVVRSALFGCLLVAAMPGARPTNSFNLLAGAALLMLLWNPADLFDLGAQLSFLAVTAILWSTHLLARRRRNRTPDPLASAATPARERFDWLRDKLLQGYAVTGAIWLFTLPLTLAWFHLFSPVGFLINVVLVPFSGPLLASGFATLAVGLLAPPLAWLPAAVYDGCLRLLLAIVHLAAETPFGHVSAPGPDGWQLSLFYSLLAAAILLPRARWRLRAWQGLATAVAVMLGWAVIPHSSADLVVTFLDVGHGGAVLFQFPGGETALFDAGSFGRGDAAEATIHRALEARRVAGLNALFLSHADSDHYNAAPGLLRRIPIAAVYISQAFPDPAQPGVMEVCEATCRAGVPLRLTQAGDSLQLSAGCRLEVLHPAATFRDRFDNAHSIVLRATYAGRTVLVTGDVEKAGVRALMESHPPGRVDVFQAPHHGGRLSNTADLARWAVPYNVVACNRDDSIRSRLFEVYPDADRILTSASDGTVTATIRQSGRVDLVTSRTARP